jgi:ATP-dependent Clp protease ATP-binding subunit ClpA
LDDSYIGTEHLLLGLLRETEGSIAGILELLGVQPGKARQQLMQVIAQAKRSPDATVTSAELSEPSEPTEAETLESEILGARGKGDRGRVRGLEEKLALIRLRELDDRKIEFVTRLISAEQRRVEIDDSIRGIMVELDRVSQQRRGHLKKFARTSLARKRSNQEQKQKEENGSDDKRSESA